MLTDAATNGDAAGVAAVTNATAAMTKVLTAINSGLGPGVAATQLGSTIIPDLRALMAAAPPPPVIAPIPIGSLNPALAALARAVVVDTTICSGQPNVNVRAFMTAYQAFMGQSGPAPSVYSTAIGSAVNAVLGGSVAPACTAIVPAPASAAATTGTSITTILIGAAAVGAVGWHAWYVTTHRRSSPVPQMHQNPIARRRRRRK
jgi:hypothetical protein